jgi:hypothetical protein
MARVDGYSISPTVAVTTVFLTISYVVMVASPSPHVFSTTTNLCYLATGFWRELMAATERHSATLVAGQMAGGALVLVMMGASSFAFHRESVMYSPAHTLDILFGWLLVTHAFYVCLSVSMLALVNSLSNRDVRAVRFARGTFSLAFLVMVFMLMVFYDDFYSNQSQLYFVVGPLAAIFVAVCRFILVYQGGKIEYSSLRTAAMELIVAATSIAAAILSQGSLLGRTLTRETTPAEYDFYHGNWHYLIALNVGMLYSRAADAARVVQGTHESYGLQMPALDWAAQLLVLMYSVLVIIFKETSIDLFVAKSALGTLSGLFTLLGIVVLVSWTMREAEGEETETQPVLRPAAVQMSYVHSRSFSQP